MQAYRMQNSVVAIATKGVENFFSFCAFAADSRKAAAFLANMVT